MSGIKFCLFSLKLFEGMKAFRGVDNHIRLFRPMLNMERMHRSTERSCLPVSSFKNDLFTCHCVEKSNFPQLIRITPLIADCYYPCLLPVQLFDKGELLECIRKLVEVDQEWVPYSQDASLYIRPTHIGTEVNKTSCLTSAEDMESGFSLLTCLLSPHSHL